MTSLVEFDLHKSEEFPQILAYTLTEVIIATLTLFSAPSLLLENREFHFVKFDLSNSTRKYMYCIYSSLLCTTLLGYR